MYKYYFILSRLLSINKFSLKSLLNISIVLSVILSSIIVPLTLSISDGFKSNIINKIIKFDGYARLYNKDLNISEHEYLIGKYDTSIIPFSEKEAIIRVNNISEGITYLELKSINYLNDFIIKSNNKNSGIYIGLQLSENLFPNNNSLDENVFIIHGSNEIYKTNIAGIFKTGIPLYDKHMIIELNTSIKHDGFIINKNDYIDINNDFYIPAHTYKDRYYDFIKWLDSYNLPINLLLFFIIVICIVNNSFCFNIDLINRENDIALINTLGIDKKSIFNILWLKYSILNFIGIFIGSISCFFLMLVEYNFNLIKLPEDIYFTSNLPISFNIINFLVVPGILLLNIIYKRIRLKRY